MFPYHRSTRDFLQVCTPGPDGTPVYAFHSNLIMNDNNSMRQQEKVMIRSGSDMATLCVSLGNMTHTLLNSPRKLAKAKKKNII